MFPVSEECVLLAAVRPTALRAVAHGASALAIKPGKCLFFIPTAATFAALRLPLILEDSYADTNI